MIYVGTCGYSYKDWIGNFYPGTVRKDEMLGYYARCFGAVEIDASFYGVLRPATISRMVAAAPPAFRYCFKAPQTVTHAPDPAAASLHPDAQAFAAAVAPVSEAKKLGAVLLQFPNRFKPTRETHAYLRRIAAQWEGLPLVAEFRNREWQTGETFGLLADLEMGWCNVDEPHFETLLHASSDAVGSIGYVRFHGRNAAQWWTGDNTSRYDYLYTAAELVPWADRVAEIEERVEQTYAFFNNHARGNAARNAEMFEDLLRERFGPAAATTLPVPEQEKPPAQGFLFD